MDRISKPGELEALRAAVLDWHRHSGRNLPWRDDRHDPYRVLVAETMLVQTTVVAVIPFYHRFLARFPTIESLASAPEAEVLKHWEGLGYYRRARQLHSLAQAVSNRFGGKIPVSEQELRSLPGVGRYIAGAIRSFAFGLPAPILEANTIRLLARVIGLAEDVSSSSSQKRLWATAETLVPTDDPGTFNQALMDLGSVVCTPKNPDCLNCPLAEFCFARRAGLTDSIPARKTRVPPSLGEEAAVILERESDGAILLLQRPDRGLWSSFWELPTFWLSGADPAKRAEAGAAIEGTEELPEAIRRLFGIAAPEIDPTSPQCLDYVVTRYKMRLSVFRGRAGSKDDGPDAPLCPSGWVQARFVRIGESGELTMPSAHRKALKRIGL